MKRNLALVALLLFASLFSCEGPEGEVGPAGPAGATGEVGPAGPAGESYDPNKTWTYKEGSMTGTATGILLDGSSFSYDLNFQGNEKISSNTHETSDATYIVITKVYAGDGESLISGRFELEFSVPDLASLSSPTLFSMRVNLEKDLGSNKVHRLLFANFAPGSTASISNLTYDAATGIMTGSFNLSRPADLSAGSVSIADGAFSTKLTQIVARKAFQ